MNENQGKPERWYQLRDRNDEGDSFIWLVLTIVFVGVIIYFVATGSCEKKRDGKSMAYSTAREMIQNAVTAYSANNNGSIPTLSGTYTNANCANCSVVNISAVLYTNGGMLRTCPDGIYLSTSGNDNCGGNASLGCRNGSSYIWIVNTNGDVFSYCAGAGCKTNNSGYQGVWP